MTHLFFADDYVLLIKANEEEVVALKETLELYENCSGQCFNVEKSTIMFSKNSKQPQKDSVKAALSGIRGMKNISVCRCMWEDQGRKHLHI